MAESVPIRAFSASRPWRIAGIVVLVAAVGSVLAQSRADVTLGYGGQIVADAWNPVRVVSRNSDPAVLEILVDQGSLREGEIPYRYRVDLPGGTGLVSFADDVYLPAWRNLQWRLSSDARLLASGSVAARDSDTRPLHLVVSRQPGRWRSLFDVDARVLERNGPDLPSRASAYDGVTTVVVDGTTAPPEPEALLAAAAAGATVVLMGSLPASYNDVALLASTGRVRLGNGMLLAVAPGDPETPARWDAGASGATVDESAIRGVLAESLVLDPPDTVSTATILILGTAYAVAVLVAVRFGRLPGVAAALALAAMTSLAAWSALHPPETSFRAAVTLEIGAGGIGRLTTVTRVLTLPAEEMTLPGAGRSLERRVLGGAPESVRIPLDRYGTATLIAPASLGAQRLEWQGSTLTNRTDRSLTDVYVLGLGPQDDLGAGASFEPFETEDDVLSTLYAGLFPHLPDGAAVARSGADVLVALPVDDAL